MTSTAHVSPQSNRRRRRVGAPGAGRPTVGTAPVRDAGPTEPTVRTIVPTAAGADRPAGTPAPAAQTGPGTPVRFSDLPLPPALIAALTRRGVTTSFAIQSATLPDALAGRDLLGRAETGSGKTLAFGLPLLARISGKRAASRRPLALILAPTRELAQQVTEELTQYADALRLRCATVVGGLSIGRQSAALERGVELVVATPGRLADLIERGHCRLDRVEIAVVDEADQMADIGFLPQVAALLEQIPTGGQRMLFSATLDRDVDRLVRRFLVDPVRHRIDPPSGSVSTMTHHLLEVEQADKQSTVAEIAARDGRLLMFVDTKRGADRLAKHLLSRGVNAAALHGGKSQAQRGRALDQFRAGTLHALVATNVAARGIHVDNLDLVLNVDPPSDAKHYLHRGGRTARAGQSGSVVTLVLPHQTRETTRLMSGAGIRPVHLRVRPGHPDLIKVTGSRTPTDMPLVPAAPQQPAARTARGGTGGAKPRTAAAHSGTRTGSGQSGTRNGSGQSGTWGGAGQAGTRQRPPRRARTFR